MSENNAPSTSRKLKSANSGERPKKPIWRFFEQGDEIDKGHYVATCLACNKTFRPGKTTIMKKHILTCSEVNHSIREAVKYMVEMRETDFFNSTTSKRKSSQVENDQTTLVNFYENSDLSKERKEVIDTALIKAFVCCGLPWQLIEHPFMIELLKQLWPNYKPPDRKVLTDTLLTQEILRVSVKCYRLLDVEDNLTLGKNFICKYFFGLKFILIKFYFILL
jgi:hypothetical protein